MNKSSMLMIALLVLILGSCSLVAEKWTLAKLITMEENIDIVGDTAIVRYCTSAPEIKDVDCSAGTSNDLTIGVSAQGGGSLGAIVAEGNYAIGVEVSSSLGFNRNSGESMKLPIPVFGYIYRYPIERTYLTYTGNVMMESSQKKRKEVSYTFRASCSLKLGEPQITTCDSVPVPATVESLTAGPTSLPTSTPVPPVVNQQLDPIIVSGLNQQGSTFTASNNGTYTFRIIGGPYSPWLDESDEGYRGWLTLLSVYRNRDGIMGVTDSGFRGPVDADSYIGWGDYRSTTDQAMSDAQSNPTYSIYLSAGEFITFVPIDEEGYYGDNRGDIILSVQYSGS